VDTAGIRRKNNVDGELERKGIMKSIESVDNSDVVLLILDIHEPFSVQDRQLGGLLERHGKSVIIIINKWDLVEDNSQENRTKTVEMVKGYFPHLKFAHIVFTSGLNSYGVHKIIPAILRTAKARKTEIETDELMDFLKQMVKQKLPSKDKGTRHPELKGFRQIGSNPPIFELFVKHKTSLHRSYLNYLENRLREKYDFIGTPIVIKLTKLKA
jgi:GTP-binding protein